MSELKSHAIALSIAILGPLINLMIKPLYSSFITNSYVYWTLALAIYVGILVPFVSKSPIRISRLIIFGITVEDFVSNIWKSVFTGQHFLPFCNWYADYFPLFNLLGEPTPYILIPRWYLLALAIYLLLTFAQYRKHIFTKLKSLKHHKTRK
jgi:hypothetical protein